MVTNTSLSVFYYFLQRDFFVHLKQFKDYFINFTLLFPIVFATTFGYILPYAILKVPNSQTATIFLATSCLIVLLDVTFKLAFDLLFDLENQRFIEYQITLLDPRLVLIERVLFIALFTFVLAAPFYPITTLLLHSYIDMSAAAWPQVYLILFLGCLVCASYQQLGALVVKNSNNIVQYWTRFNVPLLIFGGLWVPYGVIKSFSPFFGYVLLLNPLIYLTEGLRQSIIGGPEFLPVWFCAIMLLILSIVCIVITCWLFKKRTDCL